EITGGEVVDEHGLLLFKQSGYGLMNAYKNLDKDKAVLNADSYDFSVPWRFEYFVLTSIRYAWFATETMASVKCEKDYQEPSEDDEMDTDDDDDDDDDDDEEEEEQEEEEEEEEEEGEEEEE
ncbi:MAG: hypothetical protein Q9183_007628, partial [Haloplaca sp. 2 TL-2023]